MSSCPVVRHVPSRSVRVRDLRLFSPWSRKHQWYLFVVKNNNRATEVPGIVLILLHSYCWSQKFLGQHTKASTAPLVALLFSYHVPWVRFESQAKTSFLKTHVLLLCSSMFSSHYHKLVCLFQSSLYLLLSQGLLGFPCLWTKMSSFSNFSVFIPKRRMIHSESVDFLDKQLL